jgi:hypothetical protein
MKLSHRFTTHPKQNHKLRLALHDNMPSSLTSTYLLPAILLNPAVILHGFNTFMYHQMPNPPVGTSTNQWLERLGPAGSAGHYFDVHDNDQLCWWYTILMVVVQIFAYGQVNDTRVRKKSAIAAKKADRERLDKLRDEKRKSESLSVPVPNGHVHDLDGASDTPKHLNGAARKATNGHSTPSRPLSMVMADVSDTDDSVPDTSSEEEAIH